MKIWMTTKRAYRQGDPFDPLDSESGIQFFHGDCMGGPVSVRDDTVRCGACGTSQRVRIPFFKQQVRVFAILRPGHRLRIDSGEFQFSLEWKDPSSLGLA